MHYDEIALLLETPCVGEGVKYEEYYVVEGVEDVEVSSVVSPCSPSFPSCSAVACYSALLLQLRSDACEHDCVLIAPHYDSDSAAAVVAALVGVETDAVAVVCDQGARHALSY